MQSRYYSLLALLLFLSACSVTLEEANRAYDLYRFDKAASMYEELYDQDRDKTEKAAIAFKAAESYRQKNSWSKAEAWYNRAIRRDYSDPEVYYQKARVQNLQQNFDRAIETYKKYKKKAPGKKQKGEKGIEQVERYREWKNDSTRYTLEEAKRLNSRKNDYAPSYRGDRKTLIFTSDRENPEHDDEYRWTGLPFSDIYKAKWDRRREYYREIEPVGGEVNTPYNEGVTTFARRGRKMFYTQCNGPEGEKANCRIMVARKKGGGYGDPEKLPFCKDSTVNYANPSVSGNGKRLFFSSDKDGGEGGRDLYVSHYVSRSRTWGEPVNLGSKINTEKDESFPFMYKNKKLYFASKGHNSMGGYDIFVSEWDGENWSEPENLKYPINSPADDFGIVFTENGNQGHLSSNRSNGGDDIYQFFLKELKFYLSGVVTNSKSGDTVRNATVKLASNKFDEPDSVTTGEDGQYEFKLPKNARFEVDAKKAKFFRSQKKFVSTKGYEYSREFIRDLSIEPFPPKEIEVEGIYYGLDSANIRPRSAEALDDLVNTLRNNPTLKIELRSHTDCRASKSYNRDLSQRRADSVVDYLIRNDIDSARLVPKGYGESKLVNNCACENGEGPGTECTEEEHQQNRRTTFKILSTDYEPDRPELEEGQLDGSDQGGQVPSDSEGGPNAATPNRSFWPNANEENIPEHPGNP